MIGPRLPWPPWCDDCGGAVELTVVDYLPGRPAARCSTCVEERERTAEAGRGAGEVASFYDLLWLDHREVCRTCRLATPGMPRHTRRFFCPVGGP